MDPTLLPTLKVNIADPIFIGAFFGFLLALPISLFLAYWISAVKSRSAVVVGAFAGALLGFLVLLGWAGTLIFNTPLPGANGGNVFFGSVLLCSIMGVVGGMATDLLIANRNRRDYLRQGAVAEEA
ncbi:MAG TPA: PTS sucrose transporter subunit IIBC [Ktedonobacteraceae bacterium]|nr:PTS sucrose transporter subunit IIBC [Ktedonobacteraceae bacterium]